MQSHMRSGYLGVKSSKQARHESGKTTCMRKGLDLKNLWGICTDGAWVGFVAKFSEYVAKECDNK